MGEERERVPHLRALLGLVLGILGAVGLGLQRRVLLVQLGAQLRERFLLLNSLGLLGLE